MNILVINAGSSSLKYQLLNPETQQVLAKGLCERIGIDGKFTYKPEGKQAVKEADVAMPTHSEAIQTVLNALVDPANGVIGSMKEIDAVGHRVVHGGEKFAKSVLITDEVMAAIEECNPMAPLHNPANIIGIKASVVLTPYNGKIYVSARSIDEINVQVMMEKLGGGGHRTIAGAQLPGATVEEAKEKIKDVILAMKQKGEF